MIVPGIRPLIYSLVLLLSAGCATAQPGQSVTRKSLSKKEQQSFAEARANYDSGDYQASKTALSKLLAKNSKASELHYLQALVYRKLGAYDQALASLEQGQRLDGAPAPQLYAELAQLHAQLGQFNNSLVAYEQYLNALGPNARPERRQQAEALLQRAKIAEQIASQPVAFRPAPITGGINTVEHQEYFPSLSADGQSMIFTRRVNGNNEDFYRSNRQTDGTWSAAVPLEGVNTDYNEGAQSITADGNYLVFTICGRVENRGSCDLYFSERVSESGWTAAESIGRTINTEFRETQPAVSADGRLLFFSSNRPGGAGGEDLYVSGRLAGGSWSAPANAGKTVNTPGNEQFPFWAADGKTLFFTSNGHPGVGGQDLFRTQLTPQNTWQTPTNLGYPINTAGNETNLFIGLNGKTAYFSKQVINPDSGAGDVDIYSFDLPADLQPTAATYLAATIIDASTKQPLVANIQVSPITEDTPPNYFVTNDEGYFLTVLPTGKDYAVTVDQEGYLFYSDRFTLTGDFNAEDPFELIIELQPVTDAVAAGGTEADGSVAFKNVLFATGSATLLPVSSQELDRLVDILQQSPNLKVEIAGHTDDIGEELDNQQLSEERAAAVSRYLQEQGVAMTRISIKGYGESRPVASNETEAGRAENRRTTFRLEN